MADVPMKLSEEDVRYVCAYFSTLEELAKGRTDGVPKLLALIAGKKLASAPYVLPDGTSMFPRDLTALLDAAGTPDDVEREFSDRFKAEAERRGEPANDVQVAKEWEGYLGGGYAICLRSSSPENIFRKEQLVRLISAQLAQPRPEVKTWREQLRVRVDELDRLELPFAQFDRVRFGGPVSRDRLITSPRAEYPEAFTK